MVGATNRACDSHRRLPRRRLFTLKQAGYASSGMVARPSAHNGSFLRMGLDSVEIVMEVEKDFGIVVPDELASNCITVRDFQLVIMDLLVAKGRERSADLEQEVWKGLVTIVTQQMQIKPDTIRPESRWIGEITDD